MLSKFRIALAVTVLALAAVSAVDNASAGNFGYRDFDVPYLFGSGGGYFLGP
jgi:hypothetical protein